MINIEIKKCDIDNGATVGEFFLYNDLLYIITTDNNLNYSLNGTDFYNIIYKKTKEKQNKITEQQQISNSNECRQQNEAIEQDNDTGEISRKEIINKLNHEMANRLQKIDYCYNSTENAEEISEIDNKDKYFINVLDAFNNRITKTNKYVYEQTDKEKVKYDMSARVMSFAEVDDMITLLRDDKTHKMRKVCRQIKDKTQTFIKHIINTNSYKFLHPTNNISYVYYDKTTFILIQWENNNKETFYTLYYSLYNMVSFDEAIMDKEYEYLSPISYINGYFILVGRVNKLNAINILYSKDGVNFNYKNIDTFLFDNDICREYGINILSTSFNGLLYPIIYKDCIYCYLRNIIENKFYTYTLKITVNNTTEYATKEDVKSLITKFEIMKNDLMNIYREIQNIRNDKIKIIKKDKAYIDIN